MDPQLRDSLLLSVQGGHLAVMCGAGLSMSPPTAVPSAAELAQACGDRYSQVTQTHLPDDVRLDLERLADYFMELNRFREFLDFVPWETFSRNPNRGHAAIADFLCCGALTLAATTNFDTHIEDAAFELGERNFRSALDGVEAAELPDRHRPLLKLHGCHKRDSSNTLWAQSQIDRNGEIQTRLARSTTWLTGQLVGRDLVIVGFWTDWDYLNNVLSRALQDSTPRTIVVVDPADRQVLQRKAPELWGWANRHDFRHVPEPADAFLDELRVVFSRGFVKRAIAGGTRHFAALFPQREAGGTDFVDPLNSDDLYLMRKDLSGCSGMRPSRNREPDDTMSMVGAFVLAIIAAGGVLEGAHLRLQDRGIRVINCPNQLLSRVKTEFDSDLRASRHCDAVICVGATDDGAPADLVRESEPRTIVRQGWNGEWMTHESARERLGL